MYITNADQKELNDSKWPAPMHSCTHALRVPKLITHRRRLCVYDDDDDDDCLPITRCIESATIRCFFSDGNYPM